MKDNKQLFLPRIGITMGDPAGIGPELALWALSDEAIRDVCRPIVIGSASVLRDVANTLGERFETSCAVSAKDLPQDGACVLDMDNIDASLIVPGKVSSDCGRAAFDYIERAVQITTRGLIKAIVTTPISKEALSLAGIPHPGHTEALADLTGTTTYAMLQFSTNISVSFATTHVPLAQVPRELSTDRIVDVGRMTARFLHRLQGRAPVLGVCALNPHGSDGGLFGNEEQTIIGPAIERLAEEGIDARGPLVPDVAFTPESRDIYDGFLAMYHDQGHIPFKMLSFFEGVNVTLGLPIIRTSVDHGTAFDIARQGKANPGSFREAILLATKLCGTPA